LGFASARCGAGPWPHLCFEGFEVDAPAPTQVRGPTPAWRLEGGGGIGIHRELDQVGLLADFERADLVIDASWRAPLMSLRERLSRVIFWFAPWMVPELVVRVTEPWMLSSTLGGVTDPSL